MLAVACGGFYAAWAFQPGFQAVVQPQIDRVLGLMGMAPVAKPPAKPAPQPATLKAPAPTDKTDLHPLQSAPPVSANGATSQVAAANTAPTSPSTLSAATSTVQPATAATALGIKPSLASPGKPAVLSSAITKVDAASAPNIAPPIEEKAAIVLSSKGAENRLSYNPPPKLPAGLHAGNAEGTVVLKAVVDDKGKVEVLTLVEGNPSLATAAIEAVKQWRYRPYLRDGKAQPFQTVVIVDFGR